MIFRKFPSLENFSSMHHELKKKFFVNERPKIAYRGKIKLHGTNAGVSVSRGVDGTLSIQGMKRSSFVDVENDNAGFASWLKDKREFFEYLPHGATVFGEWAGPGIQKGDAVSLIPRKTFFIFALRDDPADKWHIDPIDISWYFPEINRHPDIKIVPWQTEEFIVDFKREDSILSFIDQVNSKVSAIGEEDPLIQSEYGISARGEGLVMYPSRAGSISPEEFSLVFKAKTEHHNVNGIKTKSAEIAPLFAEDAKQFAAEFVTDARMEQAYSEVLQNGFSGATQRDTGVILKWVNMDVLKESVASLETSGMVWSNVQKAVSEMARRKFFSALEQNANRL